MKITGVLFSVILLFSATIAADEANAQLRDARHSPMDWTGNIVKSPANESNSKLFGLVNFEMNHSYEMTMSHAGNQTFNQNFYTNTLHLLFNERLTGRLDVSVAHSLFGDMPNGFDNSPRVFVRNAELNYKLSDNTRIHFSFSQVPGGYGYYNPYSPFNPYNRYNRFHPYGY
jgi:hypothetical protein